MSSFSFLRRHVWLIVSVAALTVLASAWLAWRASREYEASALIRLTKIAAPIGASIDPMQSELVVLMGRTVIGNAVDREISRLGLGPDPGAAMPRDQAIDLVLENLRTVSDPSTGGVEVILRSPEPRRASGTVNAVVEAYQAVSAETARQDIRRRRAFLEDELRTTDSLLAIAEVEASSLQSRVEEEQREAQLQADRRLSEGVLSRILEMRSAGQAVDPSSLMSLPSISGDPAFRRLYARLSAYRVERQELLSGPDARSPQHPDVQRLNTLIARTEGTLFDAAREHLRGLRAQVASPGPLDRPAQTNLLLPSSVDALRRTAEQLREQYREVRLEEASETGPVEIVQLSDRVIAVRSIAWIKLLLGLLAGFVLGSGAAMVSEKLAGATGARRKAAEGEAPPEIAESEPPNIVESEAPLEAEASEVPPEAAEVDPVPNLAVIPEVSPSLVEPTANGDFRLGPLQSAGMEAYQTLRANLLTSRWGLKTLVITSAHPGEGKTTTSTNLAATYARQGLKVVLVECDLRRPSLGRYFGISKDTDLMDVLFQNHDWRKAIQLTRMPGLYVLLGEKSFPRAGESLGGPEMKRLLAELSTEYDLVILDTSPLLVADDAIVLGPIVDAILLVVRATRTDRRTVEDIVGRLRSAGGNVVGTILNDPEGVGTLS